MEEHGGVGGGDTQKNGTGRLSYSRTRSPRKLSARGAFLPARDSSVLETLSVSIKDDGASLGRILRRVGNRRQKAYGDEMNHPPPLE
jgi:hypothetical protein